MTYSIEVPSKAETVLTGRALVVSKTIRGVAWSMDCDHAGRPLLIRRDGRVYPTFPKVLLPMHRFAARFLGSVV
jgi:hypothetical protein